MQLLAETLRTLLVRRWNGSTNVIHFQKSGRPTQTDFAPAAFERAPVRVLTRGKENDEHLRSPVTDREGSRGAAPRHRRSGEVKCVG